MQYPISLTDDARNRFLEWVREYAARPPEVASQEAAWLSDFDNSLMANSERRDYEMSGFESRSSLPELFDFSDADLIWADCEE